MGIHDLTKITVGSHAARGSASEKEYISFLDVFSFLRRNTLIIGASTAVGITLGGIYLLQAAPVYQATTSLVMDPEERRVISQDPSSGTVIIESAEIASQLEIVKSEAIAVDVIRRLDLVNDPELTSSTSIRSMITGSLNSVIELVSGGSSEEEPFALSETEQIRRVMGRFLSRISVRRVGQSYVLQIGYSSSDPQKAARTANALAESYIRNGMNERAEAAKRGAIWLESRLADIGLKAKEAAIATEEFRNRHNITAVGNSSTLDQQQLSEISSQLLAARAGTATETAKLETLSKLIQGGDIDDVDLEEVAKNQQIQKLREDIRAAKARLETVKSRYSEGNPAITSAEAEIARLEREVKSELRRIASIYQANLDVAQTRERLVEEQFTTAYRTGGDKNLARVELAELESKANTYRRLYESILQQLSGTLQTLSYPSAQARVVTPAAAPFGKNWPKLSIIMPFSGMLGLAGGLLLAVLRNGLDRRTSSTSRLERELGIGSLGRIPVYRAGPRAGNGAILPEPMRPLRSILDSPYSQFSEALRGVKNSLDAAMPASGSVVIGVTSVGSGEGKTTIATNLAQLYQNEGQSVLLIDADFASARLTRLAVSAAADLALRPLYLAEANVAQAQQPVSVSASAEREPQTVAAKTSADVATMPVPLVTTDLTRKFASSTQKYGHLPALRMTIEKMRKHYNIIIVDMSGFENSADTRTICTYLDGIVLVLGNSNKMTIDRLSDALASFGRSRLALLGVIANRSETEDWLQKHVRLGGLR